jgi:hypothetical protein
VTDIFTRSTESASEQQLYVVLFCGQTEKTNGIYGEMRVLYGNVCGNRKSTNLCNIYNEHSEWPAAIEHHTVFK